MSIQILKDARRALDRAVEAENAVDLALHYAGYLPEDVSDEALKHLTTAYYAVKRAKQLLESTLEVERSLVV